MDKFITITERTRIKNWKWRLGLKIENKDWASNKTKDGTIQPHILNRSFTRTIEIKKKKQVIAFLFLLGQKIMNIKTKNKFI